MRILEFKLRDKYAFKYKKVPLDSDVCILHSNNNSTGKTTLMRAILYTLGFNIPDTELVRFCDYEFVLTIVNKETNYIIVRAGALLTINNIEFDLPVDEAAAHSLIFGISNQDLLDSLLGVIYFDQEKGWTLLNRGTIIGSIKFSIEKLFRGLKENESQESLQLDSSLKALNKKIAQYKLMANVAEYQEELNSEVSQKLDYNTYDEDLEKELLETRQRLKIVENEIDSINEVIKRNKNFVDYLLNKKIYIKLNNGEVILLTRENLYNYNQVEELNEARKSLLVAERNVLKSRIAEISSDQQAQITFEQLPTVEENLVKRLAEVKNISAVQVQSILSGLNKERKRLTTRLRQLTKNDNKWIKEAYEIINKYTQELKLPFSYKIDIFTNKLKSKSGAILHKMVFVYKLAYIKLLSKKIGYPLPIFCDSPSGREVEKEIIHDMLEIIRRDFSEHQLIIASINKYKDIFGHSNIFLMDGTLFDRQSLIDLL